MASGNSESSHRIKSSLTGALVFGLVGVLTWLTLSFGDPESGREVPIGGLRLTTWHVTHRAWLFAIVPLGCFGAGALFGGLLGWLWATFVVRASKR